MLKVKELKQVNNGIEVTVSGLYGPRTMFLPISKSDFEYGQRLRERGALIQHVFPKLSSTEREFLISGFTKEEQDSVFKE